MIFNTEPFSSETEFHETQKRVWTYISLKHFYQWACTYAYGFILYRVLPRFLSRSALPGILPLSIYNTTRYIFFVELPLTVS